MTAVGPVDHVVRLASGRGLIAAARVLARLVPQRDQPPQVHRDVVGLDSMHQNTTKSQLRAATYARLSETYDAAESVPTQLANAGRHAERRG